MILNNAHTTCCNGHVLISSSGDLCALCHKFNPPTADGWPQRQRCTCGHDRGSHISGVCDSCECRSYTGTPRCAVCHAATDNPPLPPYSGWYTGSRLCGGHVCTGQGNPEELQPELSSWVLQGQGHDDSGPCELDVRQDTGASS